MKKMIVLCAALLLLSAHAAHATVFVWKDPIYNVKVTFPDNWMRQANTDDDLRLFILGPQGSDHAACRLYVHPDGRFRDVPASELQSISNYVWSGNNVTTEYIKRFDTENVSLASFNAGGRLGYGAATYSEVSFSKRWMGGSVPMRALVAATQYAGNGILIGCEATTNGWGVWEPVFRNIIGSVSFPKFHADVTPRPMMQQAAVTRPAAPQQPIVSRQQAAQAQAMGNQPQQNNGNAPCPPCNCRCVCTPAAQ